MRVSEVAERFGWHRNKILLLIEKGEIRADRKGERCMYLVEIESVYEYIKNGMIERECFDFKHDLDFSEIELIHRVVATLTEREQKIIMYRFGIMDGYERTLQEIADIFCVTRERIREIEQKALRKLRHPSRSAMLKVIAE